MTSILISILNWNATDTTEICIRSLLPLLQNSFLKIDIRVIDNGSNPQQVVDLQRVSIKYPCVDFFFNPVNIGFTGGQNLNIQYALDENFDYVWLLNNDTVVYPNTLDKLISAMESDSICGASSPVILRMGNPAMVDFCGAIHDWKAIDTVSPQSFADAPDFLNLNKDKVWAVGTALLLRCAAVRQVGLLNQYFFAYYEDDDFGARLIANGWRTRIVLSAQIEHACFEGDMYQRPPYFFYLMIRNAIFFALAHVPNDFRRLLKLRFLIRSLYMAEKLYSLGYAAKAQACMLGLHDGFTGRGGPPVLDRPVPIWLQIVRPLVRWWNTRKT
jgi:GT2 family glycosyltransferase